MTRSIRERIYDAIQQVEQRNLPVSVMVVHLGERAHTQFIREFRPTGFSAWEVETVLGLPVVENGALGDEEVRLRFEVYA